MDTDPIFVLDAKGVALFGGGNPRMSDVRCIANTELIVHAVNAYQAHRDAVEALRALMAYVEAHKPPSDLLLCRVRTALAAVAAPGGGA